MRPLRLFATFVRIGALNELQYRANLAIQLVQSGIQLVTGLAVLALVFSQVTELNGWSQPDLLAVMGVYTIVGGLIARDFGAVSDWRADLKATGIAGRGWAWTAYDWDEGRLFNYIGDAQNTFPVWNATPLVALDVYEHAYFLDYQTDRASYIEAFLGNLDWNVVNGWVEQYGIPA